jgi:DNA replication protein DnaC
LKLPKQRKLEPPDERLCPTCYGYGYIIQENEDPDLLGKAVSCPTNCNVSESRLRLRNFSQVDGKQQKWRLKGSSFPPNIVPAIQELVDILYSELPAGFWYVHGPNGVGKSYILIAAINEAVQQRRSGLYTTASRMLDALRSSMSSDKKTEQEPAILEKIKKTTVLAIDEIGRERETDYARERLFQILDARYISAHQYSTTLPAKLTLIAGNYPPEELEPYFQSRLLDFNSKVINMASFADRRLTQE